ncbi:ABC transporter permease [Pusillimonas sp. MFBS29]|uniref:ABC transporter permease n=1 Tax=Pusillimonas sp. MFBS29 TaxID=2886690 RepID=UPI001D12E8B2|nr:ABC transporter permease [Pusillimonas sp. MFBS29]MCC2596138.1 ABC transporter permease [Pusillimonas sp. MFBS29]
MAASPLAPSSRIPLWQHRQLIATLAWRDVLGRYRGSAGGLVWSLVTPILMLAVYTIVFSGIFRARWSQGGGAADPVDYALQLFVGLVIHALAAECLMRAPTLMITNVSYVKRVVFPLEALPVINLFAAVFHFVLSLVVLLTFYLAVHRSMHLTVLWLPLIILPYAILLAGVSWLLAGLGVYLRDISQVTGLLITILMFLSPIFYPASALPDEFQTIFQFNPLTLIIEQSRAVIIDGKMPDFMALSIYTVVALVLAAVGYRAFQVMKKGFADVL